MIRRPPRSTQSRSSAASDVYKRQVLGYALSAVFVGSYLVARGVSAFLGSYPDDILFYAQYKNSQESFPYMIFAYVGAEIVLAIIVLIIRFRKLNSNPLHDEVKEFLDGRQFDFKATKEFLEMDGY
eukprot:TRINITY_DN10041_c0_g1_i9.p1 TRINITY_DN10041_c0_g1~~TRINITY_DN10041_c0_g1_i9.p1  ORF type:complete len:134 (-),score=22.45 TRINITY_DN10041_c0_g1_i9:108-485(-)